MPFLIEAMIQVNEGVPYTKLSFISNNNSLAYHMAGLGEVYHKVLSVKSVPADQALLLEYGDTQGNTDNVDGVALDASGDVEQWSKEDGESGSTATDGDG